MIKTTILSALFALSVIQPAYADFTTAAEVKPILSMTKDKWVAVREYNGEDLIYFTHLEAWRCGIEKIRFGLNSDIPSRVWTLETCYEDEGNPNIMKMEDGMPYFSQPLGSIETIVVEITYDDGTIETATYERKKILIP